MARWTDIATWVGPTRNEGDGDGVPGEAADRMSQHRGLVVHIAEGSYAGTVAWQKNPNAQVSSHFIVAKDGRISQMVDTADDSWAQIQGNDTWLSVENEGFLPDKLTAAQVEANAKLLARAHKDYGVPLQSATSPSGRGLGHHSMGAENGVDWGHSACPGPNIIAQKPEIVNRAKQIIEGDDMPLSKADAQLVADTLLKTIVESASLGDNPVEKLLKAALGAENNTKAILTALSSGVEVPALVSLTPESTTAVAKAVNDDQAARLAD